MGNTISYNVGLLKVGFVYKTTLQLVHEYDDEQFEINLPFPHTTNLSVIETIKSKNGHDLILHLHPQSNLVMNDYLDIRFIPKKKDVAIALNDENKDTESDDNVSQNADKIRCMKLKVTAKVLRKEQGTPMLKPGVVFVSKGQMYNTDMSATEWEIE